MVELPAPEQMAAELGVTVMVGNGFTVKVTVLATLVHEPTVEVTVYTSAVEVVVVLVAVTLGVFVLAPVILPPAGAIQE